ncbi:MAG: hypothetical protein WCP98_01140 [Actinomycetes bacterium]
MTTAPAESLAADLRARALVFVDLMAAAGAVAAALAELEARHRAAQHQSGVYHDHGPGPRELAAEVACGYLSPLRPHVPFVTRASADRASEELLTK